MRKEEIYDAIDREWDNGNYNQLINLYSDLIENWEPDQPLHYSGLATVQLFAGEIEEAAYTLEYLDSNVEIHTKEAQKDRDLAYGYLYAERAFQCFLGVDTEEGIEYRYPTDDVQVDNAQEWLNKARQISARDAYLKDQIKTLNNIITAFNKENKKRVFVGHKSVAIGGILITVVTLLYAFNVYPAKSTSELMQRAFNSPQNTLNWLAKLIEAPKSAGNDVLMFFTFFSQNFNHCIQFFWPGLLYLVSTILYIAVGSMPLRNAQSALNAKAAEGKARWKEFQNALNTKNTYYKVTTTTHYSDGSTMSETSTKSDDAQGSAIRTVGCIHFFIYLFKVAFLPVTALINLYRFRLAK